MLLPILLALGFQAAVREDAAHDAAMDSYFQCAFAIVRTQGARGARPDEFAAALDRGCAAAEQAMRRQSIAQLTRRGLPPREAVAWTDRSLARSRAEMLDAYVGVVRHAPILRSVDR